MANSRKTSFKPGAIVDVDVDDEPTEEVAVAATTNSSIVPVGTEGDFDASDIVYPRLTTMHKTSKLVEADDESGDKAPFKFLDVVVNSEVRVAGPKDAARIVVLAFRKIWEENLDFEDDETPRVFKTAAECIAAGLTTEYGKSGNRDEDKPGAKPKLTCVALVQLPTHATGRGDEEGEDIDLSVNFPYTYEPSGEDDAKYGGDWCVVLWELTGAAYNASAKPIITANQSKPIQDCVWSLKTRKKVFSGNTYTQHVLKRTGSTPPAFKKWAQSVL